MTKEMFDRFVRDLYQFGSTHKIVFLSGRAFGELADLWEDVDDRTLLFAAQFGLQITAVTKRFYGWTLPVFVRADFRDDELVGIDLEDFRATYGGGFPPPAGTTA